MAESIFRRDPKTGELQVVGLRYSIAEYREAWAATLPPWVEAALKPLEDARHAYRRQAVELVVDTEEHALNLAALYVRRGGSLGGTYFYERVLYLRAESDEMRSTIRSLVECIERHGVDEGGPLFAPPDGSYDLDVVELAQLLEEVLGAPGDAAVWTDLERRIRQALERQFLGKGRS